MKIVHNPVTNPEKVISHFANKGEVVRYVCTTELPKFDDIPIDIFFRDTRHPEFGNHYFGIFFNGNSTAICDADSVETLNIEMIRTNEGMMYSRFRHDYVSQDGKFVDGGRAYTRTNCGTDMYKVVEGKLEKWLP